MSPPSPKPPKPTRSGEMAAVKAFEKEIESFDEQVVPKLGEEVDRMTELLKSVTPPPEKTEADDDVEPIPSTPRMPSNVDPDELKEEGPRHE